MAQVVAVVPTVNRSAVALNGAIKNLKGTDKTVEFLEGLDDDSTLLSVMGGPGQNLFVRAQQLGLNVQRIPWSALEQLVPGTVGASGEDRAQALKSAWEADSSEFYPLVELDETVFMLRELTRVRLNIQEYRKMAQLQYQAAWRDLAPLFPKELMELADAAAVTGSKSKKPKPNFTSEGFQQFKDSLPRAQRDAVELRVMFADSSMISGALGDEKILEHRIAQLAKTLDIWDWLHPAEGAVLPQIKGLGPVLGGSLIGEIGDIKRFPTPAHLRSYARRGMDSQGRLPRRRKGEVALWNNYLDRAVWLWSTDQVWRHNHVWKDMFHFFLYNEFQRHPEVVKTTKEVDGQSRTVTQFNLKHLYKRAQRKVGSQMLKYVWGLWMAGSEGQDLEHWFRTYIRNTEGPPESRSTWDHFLNVTIPRELDGGRRDAVVAGIEQRRKLGEQMSEESDGEEPED